MPFKDPEKRREYQRQYYKTYSKTEKGMEISKRSNAFQNERRRLVLSELKSNPCEDCGNSYPPYVMDFHHRDPEDKTKGVAHMSSEKTIRAEAAKCDLLCANCHRIRTWKEKYGVKESLLVR